MPFHKAISIMKKFPHKKTPLSKVRVLRDTVQCICVTTSGAGGSNGGGDQAADAKDAMYVLLDIFFPFLYFGFFFVLFLILLCFCYFVGDSCSSLAYRSADDLMAILTYVILKSKVSLPSTQLSSLLLLPLHYLY